MYVHTLTVHIIGGNVFSKGEIQEISKIIFPKLKVLYNFSSL